MGNASPGKVSARSPCMMAEKKREEQKASDKQKWIIEYFEQNSSELSSFEHRTKLVVAQSETHHTDF